ncbi:MAG: TonB-dependent receptor, partial [Phycisphaerae bacterium]|nr:TonB-dependent receptor [Gemmatimonadaceae bacterium]
MSEGRRKIACLRAGTGLAVLMMVASTTASAMPACLSRSSITAEGLLRPYGAPLDRAVTIDESDLPLRVALERVALMSRVRLSYSADLLPDKRVCLNLDRVPAGVAIPELLRGTFLRPLVIDADTVVLTPSRGPTVSEPLPEKLNTVSELDRIVVTGTADGGKQRGSAYALDVIDRAALVNNDVTSLSAALDGAVPGMWMWSPSPSSTISRFGSVRGASSFGVTSPKIYVDGIEMANPLVLTQFDPERIDRIEVIRGPQGAALYGSGAISGVVNIITRHDGARTGGPLGYVRTRAGFSASDYASGGTFVQDHSVGVRAGTGRRSFGLGVSVGSVGDYIPGGAARSVMADGDVKHVGSRTVFTGMARYSLKNAGALASPLLLGVSTGVPPSYNTANNNAFGTPAGSQSNGQSSEYKSNDARMERLRAGYVDSTVNQSQSVQQYTIGTTGTFIPDARWTHTLVAGIDGYRMNGMTMEGIPIPVRLDLASRSVRSESDRTTLAARSIARFGSEDNVSTTLTFGAEHAATRYQPESQDTFSAGGDLS